MKVKTDVEIRKYLEEQRNYMIEHFIYSKDMREMTPEVYRAVIIAFDDVISFIDS